MTCTCTWGVGVLPPPPLASYHRTCFPNCHLNLAPFAKLPSCPLLVELPSYPSHQTRSYPPPLSQTAIQPLPCYPPPHPRAGRPLHYAVTADANACTSAWNMYQILGRPTIHPPPLLLSPTPFQILTVHLIDMCDTRGNWVIETGV